jgi:hypothetical protein
MQRDTAQRIETRWRDKPTDEAVVGVLVEANGELHRRDLARKLGHRHDFASALARLSRRNKIELITKDTPGRRPQPVVRLIGSEAKRSGVGFIHIAEGDKP